MRFSLNPESNGFFNDLAYGNNKNFSEHLKKGLSNNPNIDPHNLVLHQAPHRLNGYFCALPMTDKNGREIYYVNGQHNQQHLGSAGLALDSHANDISVLRGVYMLGNFHGFASKEIYSGSSTDAGPHVAGVLAKMMNCSAGGRDSVPTNHCFAIVGALRPYLPTIWLCYAPPNTALRLVYKKFDQKFLNYLFFQTFN